MSETSKLLIERYGLLLTYTELAEVLGRSPDGLRISLSNPRDVWTQRLSLAKVRFGRRVLFRSADVGKLIDEQAA